MRSIFFRRLRKSGSSLGTFPRGSGRREHNRYPSDCASCCCLKRRGMRGARMVPWNVLVEMKLLSSRSGSLGLGNAGREGIVEPVRDQGIA